MVYSKDDLLLGFALLIFATVVVWFIFLKANKPQLLEKEGVLVVAYFSETDCPECVEKVLCNWQELKNGIPDSIGFHARWYSKSGPTYDKELLYPLCETPSDLVFCSYSDDGWGFPQITPSVKIFLNGELYFQQPITYATDKDSIFKAIQFMSNGAKEAWQNNKQN